MKRLCLVAALLLGLSPTLVRAHDHSADQVKDRYKDSNPDGDRWHHNHDDVTAAEMAGIGIGGAALIGVAGYLILRRRNVSA